MTEPITFLRLYVNPAWRRAEGHVYSEFLFPFWGVPEQVGVTHPQTKELFESFPYDTTYYGITDNIAEADMVFVPYSQQWIVRRDPALLAECARVAKEAGLPLLVDGRADGEPLLDIPNSYITRIGGYRFDMREKGRIEVPVPADDLLLRYGGVYTARKKSEGKPSVGFSGMVREPKKSLYRTLRTRTKEALQRFPLYMRGGYYPAMDQGVFWRRKATRILSASSLVTCNFKLRDYFSGSTVSAPKPVSELQKEMVDIILSSDYALDVRGYANASTRLFEILSLGRIPIIFDTERILPFNDVVDYKKFSLIVDFRDIKRLPNIIADFHASLSPERFEEMQRAARDAYVHHFRVDAQIPHILREINKLRGAL